jgi:lysyl-tRNA synthetase class 2
MEIDTPIAVIAPGTEVHLNYFNTHWQDYKGTDHSYWLRSSPELHMKQAMSYNLERIYQFATSFRNNGEYSRWHHPEFTMLEWYHASITDNDFMLLTEQLLIDCSIEFKAAMKSRSKTIETQVVKKFEQISLAEAFKRFANIDLIDQDPKLALKSRDAGCVSPLPTDDFETSFFKVLIEKIEPALQKIESAILYDYPASQAALAQTKNGVAKRFEFYLSGHEISNGFLELIDPKENQQRLEESNKQRALLGKNKLDIDKNFIASLQKGLPQCCGNALGFDRLLALLLKENSLDNVIPFRTQAPYYQRPD